MSHPYKDQADSTHKSKTGNMGKAANKDIPIMRAVGENSGKKLYSNSSSSQQLKSQSAADGMKRGGHVGKARHSKPKTKIVIAAPDAAAPPPSPLPPEVAAGAGSSPAPAPMPPGQPPMKRGGSVTTPVALKSSGRIGGGDSGVGRLEKAKIAGKKLVKGKLNPIMGS